MLKQIKLNLKPSDFRFINSNSKLPFLSILSIRITAVLRFIQNSLLNNRVVALSLKICFTLCHGTATSIRMKKYFPPVNWVNIINKSNLVSVTLFFGFLSELPENKSDRTFPQSLECSYTFHQPLGVGKVFNSIFMM